MIHRKRIQALTSASLAVFVAMTVVACSGSTHPASDADIRQGQSDAAYSGSVLPEVVVTATRLSSPRMAKEASSRPPAKRRGG